MPRTLEHCKKLGEAQRRFLARMTPDEKEAWYAKRRASIDLVQLKKNMSLGQRAYHANLSIEEKKQWSARLAVTRKTLGVRQKQSVSLKKAYAQLPQEEKERRRAVIRVLRAKQVSTAEGRLHQSQGLKKGYQDHPERRTQRSASLKKAWAERTPEQKEALREKMRAAAKKRSADPVWCQKMRENAIRQWSSSEYRVAHRTPCTEAKREKIRISHRGLGHTLETRAKLSKLMADKAALGQENLAGYKTCKRGWWWSEKNQARIWHDSFFELTAFHILESQTDVVSYKHCPVWIKYIDETGNPRRYNPDIYVVYANGAERYIEIKPQCVVSEPRVLCKTKAAQLFFGERFVIWTEQQLGLPFLTK